MALKELVIDFESKRVIIPTTWADRWASFSTEQKYTIIHTVLREEGFQYTIENFTDIDAEEEDDDDFDNPCAGC